MTRDELHYQYKSLLTDEYGYITCPELNISDEWIPHLKALLDAIEQHLITTPYCTPVVIQEVDVDHDLTTDQKQLIFRFTGGDDYIRGLVAFAIESYALLCP